MNHSVTSRSVQSLTLIGTALLLAIGAMPARAATYEYVATVQDGRADRQGAVKAGSLTWNCEGNRCTISGPWAVPGVDACRSLAAVVGRLRSYGRKGALLDPGQMAQCNAGGTGIAEGGSAATIVKPSLPSLPARQKPETARVYGTTPPSVGGPEIGTATVPAPTANEYVAETARPATLSRLSSNQLIGWTCADRRCTSNGNSSNQGTCRALAQTVGRIVAFYGPGLRLTAQQLEACNAPFIKRVAISVRSGEDDLRRNSKLSVQFTPRGELSGGGRRSYEVLTELGQYLGATKLIGITTTEAASAGISRMRFSFKSGKAGDFDGPDNWDLQELTVRASLETVDGTTREVTLYENRGNPLHRFRDNDEWIVSANPY